MKLLRSHHLSGVIPLVIVWLIPVLPGFAASSSKLHLMPMPAQFTIGEGRMVVDQDFRVALTGYQEPRLRNAVERFLERLRERTGIPLSGEIPPEPGKAKLTVNCKAAGEPIQSVRADESYSLEVTADRAHLSARSPIGILRGLETFLQLVEIDGEAFGVPAVRIEDRPRFPWRGLMIDVCLHWQPVDVVKRNLDAMASLKLNVFHWHLSEDQGFRVESKVYPRLHELGSDGNYYTQAQIRDVVAYARDRGIRIVPEFDMPGHTTAWFVGYPELASAPGPYELIRRWGIFDPTMDPTREELYRFLDSFIGEMVQLFPDEYFHIGGDENNGKQWNANPRIQAFKKEHNLPDNLALQAHFNKRLLEILTRHGKKMIGWDEILHTDLPRNIIIHSWRGEGSLAKAAQMGFMGILSHGYYLDLIHSAASHYDVDPLEKETENLTSDEKARILGGEACMWTEYVTAENIDSRIWPRSAAVAERLWSPADVKDVKDMYRRLEYVSRDLDLMGLTHLSSYPHMLRRLAGKHPTDPVRVLSDVLEPVKGYARGRTQLYTSFTPLNRLVDATRPESDAARKFNSLVDEVLAAGVGSKSGFHVLRERLSEWRSNDAKLKPIIEGSFLLREAGPLSEALDALAETGLQAVHYLESSEPPPAEWRSEQAAVLERAAKPQAALLIMIVPGVRKLADAAAQIR